MKKEIKIRSCEISNIVAYLMFNRDSYLRRAINSCVYVLSELRFYHVRVATYTYEYIGIFISIVPKYTAFCNIIQTLFTLIF